MGENKLQIQINWLTFAFAIVGKIIDGIAIGVGVALAMKFLGV